MKKYGKEGVEPSGTAFNSLVQLEHEKVSREIHLLM
jgi:glutaminase